MTGSGDPSGVNLPGWGIALLVISLFALLVIIVIVGILAILCVRKTPGARNVSDGPSEQNLLRGEASSAVSWSLQLYN